MKILNRLKAFFLMDFVRAYFLAQRYFFKKKSTLNYPYEKGKLSPDLEENMHSEDTLVERSVVLAVNYVRQFVPHKL